MNSHRIISVGNLIYVHTYDVIGGIKGIYIRVALRSNDIYGVGVVMVHESRWKLIFGLSIWHFVT